VKIFCKFSNKNLVLYNIEIIIQKPNIWELATLFPCSLLLLPASNSSTALTGHRVAAAGIAAAAAQIQLLETLL
jgi:hypothetical protein